MQSPPDDRVGRLDWIDGGDVLVKLPHILLGIRGHHGLNDIVGIERVGQTTNGVRQNRVGQMRHELLQNSGCPSVTSYGRTQIGWFLLYPQEAEDRGELSRKIKKI